MKENKNKKNEKELLEEEMKIAKRKKAMMLKDSWQSMLALLDSLEKEGEDWEEVIETKVPAEEEELPEPEAEVSEEREEAKKRKREGVIEEQQKKKLRHVDDDARGCSSVGHLPHHRHHHPGKKEGGQNENVCVFMESSTTKKLAVSDIETCASLSQSSKSTK